MLLSSDSGFASPTPYVLITGGLTCASPPAVLPESELAIFAHVDGGSECVTELSSTSAFDDAAMGSVTRERQNRRLGRRPEREAVHCASRPQ